MNISIHNQPDKFETEKKLRENYGLSPFQLKDLRLDPDALEVENITKAVERANEIGIPLYDIPYMIEAVSVLLNDFLNNGINHRQRSLERLNRAWRSFEKYVISKHPSETYIPSKPKLVCDFINDRHKQGIHRNTLKLELWAIRSVHRATGMPDPTVAKSVEKAIGRVINDQVNNEIFIKQATPLGYDAITVLLKQWRLSGDLSTSRDLAYIVAGYEGLLRHSEIANIRMRHITPLENGTLRIVLPITKTNHSGDADVIIISKNSRAIIEEYMTLAGIVFDFKKTTQDYLFKPTLAWGEGIKETGKPLSHNAVMKILGKAFNVVYNGIEDEERPKKYTAHSMRVGAAQDMFKRGVELSRIMKAGRWSSSDMPMRYGRGHVDDGAASEILNDAF
ncbi:tyrosine-type recombinase/integrase [Photobacterium carnosum]|uniref:Tyr recombinase domain-containing protein n=1 Tax=Photobacterium carnosum TaxID=2023717 RepID=A0A2N4UW66_9GAMM|nr:MULTISPECIES: tyrosine-type recombinase/integrase [Photobacterium]MCD9475848.1 tyrosine-type recombinase/integrase [Photobacterium phosphoreum]MCD9485899.1 tyrosine-type recombinase/integrase [Photobacterium iliopiscarium]MCD9507710.1 tyrosine-type recombinase/integrase [Photobacterium phosphoreum]MCD9538169.1 tyrosine-type recombinase/integrase [Photobacterium carnosum]MCD9542544.1 tyrosine-type recombinase/integrase [Photobacterium carnosum]